jgi:predicted glutamine amidotransferase
MCGLVGMVGRSFDSDRKALRTLLRLDVLRGEHSTGLAIVDYDSEIKLLKKVGTPDRGLFPSFTDDFDEKGVFKGTGKVFIGHNRYATKGGVNDKNAHPFHHDGIVGAHNGTLTSVSDLEDGHKFDVDSEAIFYDLSIYDREDTISRVEGAYALTWYDQMADKLFIIRNSKRPLFYTRRTDKDVIFWASEAWMLEVAMKHSSISHGPILPFNEDTLYSFDCSAIETNVNSKHRSTTFEMKSGVKGKSYKPVTSTHHYNSSSSSKTNDNSGVTKSNVHPFPSSRSNSTSYSPGVNKEEFQALLKTQSTTIEFRFNGVRKGAVGAEYLHAYPDDPKLNYDIRIFGAGQGSKWGKWKSNLHRTVYKGKVKRVVKNHVNGGTEVYLLIDLRTIEKIKDDIPTPSVVPEIDPADDKMVSVDQLLGNVADAFDSGELYHGFNGSYLNKEEWLRATCHGCANCNANAEADDMDLQFVSHDEFVCGDCVKNSPFVQEYVNYSNK